MIWLHWVIALQGVLLLLLIAYTIKFKFDYNWQMRILQSFCFDYAELKESLKDGSEAEKGDVKFVSVRTKDFLKRGAR
jgi:hypothetical protein